MRLHRCVGASAPNPDGRRPTGKWALAVPCDRRGPCSGEDWRCSNRLLRTHTSRATRTPADYQARAGSSARKPGLRPRSGANRKATYHTPTSLPSTLASCREPRRKDGWPAPYSRRTRPLPLSVLTAKRRRKARPERKERDPSEATSQHSEPIFGGEPSAHPVRNCSPLGDSPLPTFGERAKGPECTVYRPSLEIRSRNSLSPAFRDAPSWRNCSPVNQYPQRILPCHW